MWLLIVLASAACWAMVNVLDSGLVRHYHKDPIPLMWSQSMFTVIILTLIACFMDVRSTWAVPLMLCGMVAYVGDQAFFRVLDKVEASVSSIAWAMLAVILSVIGFISFGESWTLLQWSGAGLVLIGVVFLSLWHEEVSWNALAWMLGLALLYVPFYVAKKSALLAGQSVVPVFFWLLIGRESFSFFGAMIVPAYRRRIKSLLKVVDTQFFVVSGLVIAAFFTAEYLGTKAYSLGPMSLVSIVGNVQPFYAIFFSWLMFRLWSSVRPKEVLEMRSVGVKLATFLLVFCGLALLAVSQ